MAIHRWLSIDGTKKNLCCCQNVLSLSSACRVLRPNPSVLTAMDGDQPMRLYLVTESAMISAIMAGQPLNWVQSLILDDIHEGTICVPSLAFYHFRWLDQIVEEFPDDDWGRYRQVAIDFPEEIVKPYERVCPDGGNSVWHPPLNLIRQYTIQTPP